MKSIILLHLKTGILELFTVTIRKQDEETCCCFHFGWSARLIFPVKFNHFYRLFYYRILRYKSALQFRSHHLGNWRCVISHLLQKVMLPPNMYVYNVSEKNLEVMMMMMTTIPGSSNCIRVWKCRATWWYQKRALQRTRGKSTENPLLRLLAMALDTFQGWASLFSLIDGNNSEQQASAAQAPALYFVQSMWSEVEV